jgi:chromosome segregation ATPase
MKTLKEYLITESDNNWLDSFLSKIEGLNTDGKLEQHAPLYGIFVDYSWNRCEVRDGYGRLMDEENAMNHISTATITSLSPIFVVTTDKGNFYGVTNSAVKDKTELASLFKNRVKGASKMVFTKSLDNVKKYIEKTTTWVKTFDELPSAEKVWMYGYGAFTTKEKAREAASKLSKIHKMNTKIKWYDEKSAELEATIKQREESIKYYEENIERVKKEIEEIKNDLAEYKLAKDLASTDLNESLVAESMSHQDVVALEDVIKRFIDAGGKDKLAAKLFNGDDMKPEVIKILDEFDEYAEDVLWTVLNARSAHSAADRVKDMAEENENEMGTEPVHIIDMLEDIARFLKI